jgi:hypothetical protein
MRTLQLTAASPRHAARQGRPGYGKRAHPPGTNARLTSIGDGRIIRTPPQPVIPQQAIYRRRTVSRFEFICQFTCAGPVMLNASLRTSPMALAATMR